VSSKNLSSIEILSQRYAAAFYELSTKTRCTDNVLKDLIIIKNNLNNSDDFNLLLRSPLISSEDKFLVIKKLLQKIKSHSLTINFMKVVNKNKRFTFLSNIISRFEEINSEKRGEIVAEVISSEELKDSQKKDIEKKLHNSIGNSILLKYKIDEKIIGGLIIKIGSKMIDTSLNTKINKLKLAMKGAL
tara:strand:+ start:20947 stop:21510 length:564 start_codon:yes stop_codon:yes gene_type:complete